MGCRLWRCVDRQRLYQIIDQALAETKGQATSAHHGTGEFLQAVVFGRSRIPPFAKNAKDGADTAGRTNAFYPR